MTSRGPDQDPKWEMTITLNLTAETERRLREKAAGRGQTVQAYLEQLAEEAARAGNGTPAERPPEQWIAQWRAWAASHPPLPQAADDSRESIYSGE